MDNEELYSPTHQHSFIFHLSLNGIIQHNRIFSAQTHLHFKRTEKDGLSSCRWHQDFFSLTTGPGICSFISSFFFFFFYCIHMCKTHSFLSVSDLKFYWVHIELTLIRWPCKLEWWDINFWPLWVKKELASPEKEPRGWSISPLVWLTEAVSTWK